jgi:hypothetical protein
MCTVAGWAVGSAAAWPPEIVLGSGDRLPAPPGFVGWHIRRRGWCAVREVQGRGSARGAAATRCTLQVSSGSRVSRAERGRGAASRAGGRLSWGWLTWPPDLEQRGGSETTTTGGWRQGGCLECQNAETAEHHNTHNCCHVPTEQARCQKHKHTISRPPRPCISCNSSTPCQV